jgi:hypothetical protein
MTFTLGCGFFVTGAFWTRAIGVTKVDVREGSVAGGVRTQVIEVDAEQIFRVV